MALMTEDDVASILRVWHNDTFMLSSTRQIMRDEAVTILEQHPTVVIPYIIDRFRRRDFANTPIIGCLLLLAHIVGVNPVPPKYVGIVLAMANHWVMWYDENYEAFRDTL